MRATDNERLMMLRTWSEHDEREKEGCHAKGPQVHLNQTQTKNSKNSNHFFSVGRSAQMLPAGKSKRVAEY